MGGYETKEVTSTMLVSEAEDMLASHVRKMLEDSLKEGEK